MRAVRAGDRADERTMMHLPGQGWENAADLDAVRRGVNGGKLALHGPARFGIPSINMAHAAAVPEKNNVLGFCGDTPAVGRQQPGHRHPQKRGTRRLQHAPAGQMIIKASRIFHVVMFSLREVAEFVAV